MKVEVKDKLDNSQMGDYFVSNGVYNYEILDTGNDIYNRLILIHELTESLLIQKKGISPLEIEVWDNLHLDADEPGEVDGSPYKAEHLFAESIERQLCALLEIDWNIYCDYLKTKYKEVYG